jgi:polyhydroxyalkanoate synthase
MQFSCLSREKVAQRITPGRIRWFHKEILEVRGPERMAVVRKRRVDGESLAPVILVHGFAQNRYAWHLPERSFANHLADRGFDVFNVDLRGHGRSRELGSAAAAGVDDYIRGDLPALIDAVLAMTGHAKVFLVGHSLGGLCAAAAAALDPERVAAVVTVGSPHALGEGHMLLGGLLRVLGRTLGRSQLWRGSDWRIPVDLVGRTLHLTRLAWESKRAPLPIRAWKPGTLSSREVASYVRSFDGASLGTADDLIQLALTGELPARTGPSYTSLIERSAVPLLAISGEEDLVANPRAVKPLFEKSIAHDKAYVKVSAGHSDLLIGNQAPEHVWPVVSRFLEERRALAQQPVEERQVG